MTSSDEAVEADRQELAELLGDLRAWTEWEAARGARIFPREELSVAKRAQSRAPSTRRTPSPPAARKGSGADPRPTPQKPPVPVPPASPGLAPRRPPSPKSSPERRPSQGSGALGAWGPASPPSRPPPEAALPAGLDLPGVRAHLGDCRRCGLCEGRSQIVFGVGTPDARLLILGEAPGFHEDRRGEPFVGRAGQMLDRMVENVLGLKRSQVYIANVVKCRPPDNRDPRPAEITACRPFLDGQISAIAPDFILVLGRVAAQTIFETSRGIRRLRGEWRTLEVGEREIPTMCTYHPAYLLRQPSEKRATFEDLKALRARMQGRA